MEKEVTGRRYNSVACYVWTNVYKKHWVYDVTVVINERKLRGSNFQKHNYHIWWWPEEDGPAFNDLVVTEAYPAQRATRKSKKEKFKKVFILFCFSKILDSFLGENHAILPYHTVTKVKRNVQKLLPAGFEPMTTSCGPHTNDLDHCATKEVLKFGSKLISYSTPKIDQLWLLLKAKNGQDWFWPLF